MSYTIESTPLTTPSRVKAYAKRRYLNFDYTTRYPDDTLTEMIREAQRNIEEQTGLIFNKQDVVETWNGEDLNGGTLLQPHFYPILLVDSNGTALPVTLTIDGVEQTQNTDYYVTDPMTGAINTITFLPCTDYNNVVLEYSAGYDPAHPSAKALCEALVVYTMYMERETPPSLQDVIQQQETSTYNKGTDKQDKLVSLVFDIGEKFKRLPHRLFLGFIEV